MMAGEFWLSEAQWGAIEPLLPKNQPGARRTDDRRVVSGIVHVLKTGCRWQDCPAVYGPSTTVYNRFRRWTMRGIWRRLFAALARARWRQALRERSSVQAAVGSDYAARLRAFLLARNSRLTHLMQTAA
jgi:transposase